MPRESSCSVANGGVDFGQHHDVDMKSLTVADDTEVKVQFAKWRDGWKELIPVTPTPVRLRYSDLPHASDLTVPTPVGFAAMKLIAWSDRHAPRDLFDLYGLAKEGFIDEEVQRLHKSVTGVTPTARTLEGSVPSRGELLMESGTGAPAWRSTKCRGLPGVGRRCSPSSPMSRNERKVDL